MSSASKAERGSEPSHTNFEMYDIDPLNYTPESDKGRIRSRIVSFVHFVAHSTLESGGNHWDIFLETDEGRSVSFEMTPGAFPGREGFLGRLDIIHHPNPFPGVCHKAVSIPAQPGSSVANFLDAIVQADNHRYEFTREGRGCTGWVRDQFHLFAQVGLLPSGSESTVEAAITTAWEKHVSKGLWHVTYGTYLRSRGGREGSERKESRSPKKAGLIAR